MSKTNSKNNEEYSIDDMKKMFGKRISNAVFENKTPNQRIYIGLIAKEMSKLCKWWKFWNKDICRAYKKYTGLILAPYIIKYEDSIVVCDNILSTKEIFSRYEMNHIPK